MPSRLPIGIDLGTTHSVVAVPEVVAQAGTVLPELGVTVITDNLKRKTFPSVVALGPDGSLIVGHKAKQRAGADPEPIMFAKRQMGTDVTWRLGERRLRPQDVSAEVLKFLKALAEERLGQPVGPVVVTVPAYFDFNQQRATREAAELAGLEVGAILIEPVAAALSYLFRDDRDPLRVMLYDLGGGTFDVTLLEKRGGEFFVLKFGGDPFLGGYDFDKALVGWLCERLKEDGYRLEFDLERSPEDRAKFQKLLVNVAEPAKIELSAAPEVPMRHPAGTLFADKNGEEVVLDLYLTREEFEELIRGEPGDGGRDHRKTVERTIELCRATLAKAGISPEALDEIVLVGGSTYIPLVQRRLEEEFGKRPRLFEPDLAVAVGAALKAASFAGHVVEGKARVFLVDRYPRRVPPGTESVDVAGRIEAEDPGAYTVRLRREDGQEARQVVSGAEGGTFLLPVGLLPGDRTVFDLEVLDAEGREVAREVLEVMAEEEPPEPTLAPAAVSAADTYITKPFYVETANGLELIAEEGTPLPYTFGKTFRTAGEGSELHVPIWEEDREVGRIKVPGLEGLPAGSPVEVQVDFGADFRARGEAYVPPPFSRRGEISIEMSPVEVPPLVVLREEFEDLKDRFEEALQLCPDPNRRLELGAEGKRIIASLEEMFCQVSPDTAQIARTLARLRGISRELGRIPALRPPWEEFEEMVQEARRLARQAEEKEPSLQGQNLLGQIEALERHGREFYEQKDQANWQKVCETLQRLVASLRDIVRGPSRKNPFGEMLSLYQLIVLELEEIAERIRAEKREDLVPELESARAELQKIDIWSVSTDQDAQRALARLWQLYVGRIQPLKKKLNIDRERIIRLE